MIMIDLRDSLPRDPVVSWEHRPKPANLFCVHHSATSISVTAEQMARYHISKGWPGLAYGYVIGADGTVYFCNDDELFPWHGNDFNTGIGVCLVGNFTTGRPTDAQIKAARELYRAKRSEYGDLPLVGHKEAPRASTVCPGGEWDIWKQEILKENEMPKNTKTTMHVQRRLFWMPSVVTKLNAGWVKEVNPPVGNNPWPAGVNVDVRYHTDAIDSQYIPRGREGGRAFVRDMFPFWRQHPYATCYELANEPSCQSPLDLLHLCEYSIGAMEEADRLGIKLCIFNLSEGKPAADDGITDEAKKRDSERGKLETLFPAAKYAVEHGHYIGEHAYWRPGIEGPTGRWHALGRIVWNVEQWQRRGLTLSKLKFLVNETGIDGGIASGPTETGWQKLNPNGYVLEGRHAEIFRKAYPWMLALAFFTAGFEPPWKSFDHDEAVMLCIISQLPANTNPTPAPTDPLPENEPAEYGPAQLLEKVRWWTEEYARQKEAGNTERADEILYSLIKLGGGLMYRLENALKAQYSK